MLKFLTQIPGGLSFSLLKYWDGQVGYMSRLGLQWYQLS